MKGHLLASSDKGSYMLLSSDGSVFAVALPEFIHDFSAGVNSAEDKIRVTFSVDDNVRLETIDFIRNPNAKCKGILIEMYRKFEAKSMVYTFEILYLRVQTDLEDVLGLESLLQ
mgnify:CR=1 FL=1